MMLCINVFAHIKEVTSQLFYEKVGNLYYVAEKIADEEQFATWQLMVAFNQGNWASQIKEHFSQKSALISGVIDASGSLLAPLCDWKNTEAWVIYATIKEPTFVGFSIPWAVKAYEGLKEGNWEFYFSDRSDFEEFKKKFEKKASQIEIVVGLSTNEDAPFQNHQGIFRNLKYILAGNTEHPGLAISLHGFAAKWSLQVLKNKKYVLVAPMHTMADILRSKLNEKDYVIGKDNKIIQVSGNITSGFYVKDCPQYQLSPGFEFKLYNKQGNMLLSLKNNALENSYRWALSKLYLSQSYPLFTIDLEELAKRAP